MDYTTKQAAHLIGCTPRYVRELCDAARFPSAYRVTGPRQRSEWRIPHEDLLAYIASKEIETEVLSPEDSAIIPYARMEERFREIVRQEIAEVRKGIAEEQAALVEKVTEQLDGIREEHAEARKIDAERVDGIAAEVAEWRREREKKKPSLVERLMWWR